MRIDDPSFTQLFVPDPEGINEFSLLENAYRFTITAEKKKTAAPCVQTSFA